MRGTGLAFLVVCHQHTQDSLIKRTLSVDLGTVNEKQAVKQALPKQQQYVETFVAGEFHDTRANDDNQHPHKNNPLYSM